MISGAGWTRNCTHTLCVPTKLTCSTESSGHCHIMQKRNASYLGLQSIRCSNLRLLALLVCSNLQHSGKHEILTRKVRWDLNWVLGRGSEGILRTCSRNHWLEIARRQFPDLNICVQIVQWRTSFASLKVGILRSLQQTPLLVFRLCNDDNINGSKLYKRNWYRCGELRSTVRAPEKPSSPRFAQRTCIPYGLVPLWLRSPQEKLRDCCCKKRLLNF